MSCVFLLLRGDAGCECCGISSWYRESHLESLGDILLTAATAAAARDESEGGGEQQVQVLQQVQQQAESLAPRGLCQACVDMLHSGKGYCSICYKKYIDDTPLYAAPNKGKGKSKGKGSEVAGAGAAPSMGSAVAEEAQQMVCCDECNEWVHSKCEGIDASQYESIANGTHPVWVSDLALLLHTPSCGLLCGQCSHARCCFLAHMFVCVVLSSCLLAPH
jgi:hypothetical protein